MPLWSNKDKKEENSSHRANHDEKNGSVFEQTVIELPIQTSTLWFTVQQDSEMEAGISSQQQTH